MIYPSAFVATPSTSDRPPHLTTLYEILGDLANRTDGPWTLGAVDGHQEWPDRGIYL